jgi:hypothetical protein
MVGFKPAKKRSNAMLDRSEINRALAKAIAYKQCGKEQDAQAWARKLVELLECASILAPQGRA